MRILAIRGQNLASLARSFEVDLLHGPLAGAGIFAITGPVGAGKSTLLDALCLPLFDRTPRLSGRGGAPVGDDGQDPADWLRSHDPRTLLRRDAAAGFAEVDFVGRDGVRYRAHWSVRRARRRADGRVQEQELLLTDLDRATVVASGRKSDVLAAVQARLGLDFAQFCRSVLLAQGDFAAFLRASADDRARLLETLTGADVYRRLSKAAHERARATAAVVERVRLQLDAQAPMQAAARAAAETEAAQLSASASACRVGIDLASRYVAWHDVAEQHRHSESEATVALQAAIEAHAGAAARRQQLEQRQRAMAVVPRFEVATAASAAAAQANEAVALARATASAAAAAASAGAQRLRARLQATLGDFVGTEVPAIVRELPQWEPLLRQWQQVEQELAALAVAAPQLEAAVTASAGQHQREVEAGATAAQVVLAAAAALARAQAAAAAIDGEALARDRAALEVRRAAADELVRLAAAWQQAAATTTALAARRREAAAAGEVAAQAVVAAQQRTVAATTRLTSARQQRDAVHAHAGLAALRSQLVEGAPCPLCGATAHAPAAVPDVDLTTADAVLAAAEGESRAAAAALAKAEAEAAADARDGARIAGDLAAATRAMAAAQQACQRAAAVEAADDIGTPDAAQALAAARLAAVQPEAARVTAAEAHSRGLATALQAAVRAAQDADAAWRQGEQRRRDGERAWRAAVQQRDTAQAAATAARARVEDLHAALQGPCAAFTAGAAALAALGASRLELLRSLHALAVAQAAATMAAAAAQLEATRAEDRATQATGEAASTERALQKALAIAAVSRDDVAGAVAQGAEALADEARSLRALDEAVDSWRTVLRERVSQRRRHEDHERPSLDAGEAAAALRDARDSLDAVERQLREAQVKLHADDLVQKQRAELAPRLDEAERVHATWQALDDLIGSSTGDEFAVFAQGLTLDLLLLEANRRLAELARRYRLHKNPEAALDFVVVDLDLGGSRRSVQTLSGGETFLVSLALALALATLAAPKSRVETLFLDEGFGTLDAQNLEIALGALDSLQATGCQIGVISHVDGIAERIGAQVRVQPDGSGQSRVFAQAR